jgi:ketosteroid isomerase-like protein
MSQNKQTVQKYMVGFTRSDHGQILSCLTDDVEWLMPGAFHLSGKDAFDKEIENLAFVGSPEIEITRMTEENDVVVAEGTVRAARRAGGFLNAVFCDVFVMQDAKIRQLTSYLVEIKD